MTNAKIIKADGTEEDFTFEGEFPGLEAMQKAVGGYIEVIAIGESKVMVLNEEGKLEGLPENDKATTMTRGILSPFDVVVGDVIIMDEKLMQ